MTSEVAFTDQQFLWVLGNIPAGAILVGGQALMFWVQRYGIDYGASTITMDTDFFGTVAHVGELAKRLHGTASYPPQRALTILRGQVTLAIDEKTHLNIDVIHTVAGVTREALLKRAVQVTYKDVQLLVMHELDVLASRVENLATIQEKQKGNGVLQLELAVRVVHAYVCDVAATDQKRAMRAIERIVDIAKSKAGQRCYKQFGVNVFAALPSPDVIVSREFHDVRWPRLLQEMAKRLGPGTKSRKP